MTNTQQTGGDRPVSEVLRDRDPKERLKLLGRDDLRPEVLFFLASDPDVDVRRAVASRHALPMRLLSLLAVDEDSNVRLKTVARIQKLLPELDKSESQAAQNTVKQLIAVLARDKLVDVRRHLAEVIKDRTDVPEKVVFALARDEDELVQRTVLEFSPRLGADDLIDIIAGHPITSSLVAIARRRSLHASVSDAIVRTETPEAIGALLSNQSAQIREDTLDRIVAMAPSYPSWHTSLIRREDIPERVVMEVAKFISDVLLEELAGRQDLSAALVADLRSAMSERLTTSDGSGGPILAPAEISVDDVESQIGPAETMARAGRVDEQSILDSVRDGRYSLAIAMICHLARMEPVTVIYGMRSRDPRSWVAVLWRAGIPATVCEQLQTPLAGILPAQVLKAEPDGSYAITSDERDWHIEMLRQRALEAF